MSSSSTWKFHTHGLQAKQFPLYFANPHLDAVSKSLTAYGNTQPERIIYMGPRYTSNAALLRAYSSSSTRTDNSVVDPQIYGEGCFNRYQFTCNEKQKYYPVRSAEYRLFSGVNPTTSKDELRFDANFECGNLDLVVALGNHEYDLSMRVDSNTKGHTCWFFFKVSNFTEKQRVRLNLVNFSRGELSYELGMKVYIYTSSSREWMHGGEHLQFYPARKCKYSGDAQASESSYLYTLSFDYEFKIQDEYVYFAYCIPYSYSFLEYKLREIEKKYPKIVEIDRSNLSTGGLQIPVLTVTNREANVLKTEEEESQKKQVCLIVGRLHPGETQASWLLHGFIEYLCSPKGKQLRSKIIFKIIPMVNVDGVVAGNFRTHLLGRDLNRFFNQPHLLSEIALIRTTATQFKPFMFLDYHGHSCKKNIFVYGPDYTIDNRYFLPSRLFPKLISKCTKSFRYYACNFRVSPDKRSTGRAVMLRSHQVAYCFTVEASSHAFGPKKDETLFNRIQYVQSGAMICLGLDRFIKVIFTLPKRLQLSMEVDAQKSKQIDKKVKSSKVLPTSASMGELSSQNKKLLQEIMNDEKESTDLEKDNGSFDSDFEQGNDYTEKELTQMLDGTTPGLGFKRKKVKKLATRKFEANQKLNSEGSLKEDSGRKFSPIKETSSEYSKRGIKYQGKLRHGSPQIEKTQSESRNFNFQSLHSQNYQNRHRLKQSKIFSDESCLVIEGSMNLHNTNNLSRDYPLNKVNSEYEPLSQFKKMKEKTSILIRKRSKMKEKEAYHLPEQSQREKEGISEIKRSLLPLLGRSANLSKEEGGSAISAIFENRQQSRNNRLSRNIKILYP